MKFIISVVMLALAAANASAGYLPAAVDLSYGAYGAWGAPGWSASYWGGPAYGYGPYGPSLTQSWGAPYAGAPYAGVPYAGVPYAGPYHGPTTAVHADPVHGHDGKYVAANRGSVHVAPLVGHIQSVASTNLQPAPGTNW